MESKSEVVPTNHGGVAQILKRQPRHRTTSGKSDRQQAHILKTYHEMELERIERQWAEQEAWDELEAVKAKAEQEERLLKRKLENEAELEEKLLKRFREGNLKINQAKEKAIRRLAIYQGELKNATERKDAEAINKFTRYIQLVKRDHHL